MEAPRAIIFDLDGTIINSEPAHKLAEIIAFREFGIEMEEEALLPFTGVPLPQMLESMALTHETPLPIERFLEVEIPILSKLIKDEVQVFSDADLLLDHVSHLPLALATSSMKWYVNEVFSKYPELPTKFTSILCQADVKNGKPHPEIFQKSCDALRCMSHEAWVIEDSVNGIKAAKAAGCFAVGIDRENQGHLGEADLIVSNLAILVDIIRRDSVQI